MKAKEDDALLAAIKEVGLAAEEFSRDAKPKDQGPGATPSEKGKGNGTHKQESEKTNATVKEDSAPAGKKDKKAPTTGSGSGQPRFSKDQEDEARKGIPDNLRKARGKKELCTHWGLNNHGWQWCRREIFVSLTRNTEKAHQKNPKIPSGACGSTPEHQGVSQICFKPTEPP